MTDLDYIHQAIIDSKGCDEPTDTIDITENGEVDVTNYATANVNVAGGDNFPYEYFCPEDFSVTIQPEDWDREEGEDYASVYIQITPTSITGVKVRYWKCNGERPDLNYNTLSFSESWCEGEVTLDVSNGALCVSVNIWNIFTMEPITLNFTDLIFIGNKKQNSDAK